MTVIAFRPRPRAASDGLRMPRCRWWGRSGRHVADWATWWVRLRVHRLLIVPRGTFVTGVFTGELRDDDGSLVGVDTRRATIAADLVRRGPRLPARAAPLPARPDGDHRRRGRDHDRSRAGPEPEPEPSSRAAAHTARSARGAVMKLLALLTPCAMLAVLWALAAPGDVDGRLLGSAWSRPHARDGPSRGGALPEPSEGAQRWLTSRGSLLSPRRRRSTRSPPARSCGIRLRRPDTSTRWRRASSSRSRSPPKSRNDCAAEIRRSAAPTSHPVAV